ncbi:hypothetical protein Unana1_03721 [Umbelopsis nana]
MARYAPARVPLTDNEPKSLTRDRLPIPFLSPPSAVHFSLLGYRGSSAPAVLSRPDKQSPRNTVVDYFRSYKVRPASSYAESGPHSQASRKHLLHEKQYVTPTSPRKDRSEKTSGGLAMGDAMHHLAIGETGIHRTLAITPPSHDSAKKLSTYEDDGADEKSFVSLEESQASEEQHLYQMYGAVHYDPYRPRSFPYFLPKPLKRVLNRHTWTEYDEAESSDDPYRPSFSLASSTNSQAFFSHPHSQYDASQGKSVIHTWRGDVNDPSPAPSSTQIIANLQRRAPTVSSLSMSESSHHMLRAAPNMLSSPMQIVDIDTIEKGYPYKPSTLDDLFWNLQTYLFLFGFIAFPCWWIGAFMPTSPSNLKLYNVKMANDRSHHRGSTTPFDRTSSPNIISVQPPQADSKSTAKHTFRRLNRVMTIISVVVVILVAAMMVWYERGFSHK